MAVEIQRMEKMTPLESVYQNISAGKWDTYEREVYEFLEKQEPALAPLYKEYLDKGRETVLKALVSAMLREDIAGLSSQAFDLRVIDRVYAFHVPIWKQEWHHLLKKLSKQGLKENIIYKVYALNDKAWVVIPVQGLFAFRRYIIDGPIYYVTTTELRALKHPVEWIYLFQHCGEYKWVEFAEELRNACANQTLAYVCWDQKKKSLKHKMDNEEVDHLVTWVSKQKEKQSQFDSHLFFEQFCMEGHNLHPSAKTKMDMEPAAVYAYAPECQSSPQLYFVAVHKEIVEWTVWEKQEEPNACTLDQYPDLLDHVKKKGIDLSQYVLIPVHAWQMKRVIPVVYEQEMAQQLVIPITDYYVPCKASSSFRTIHPEPLHDRRRWAVKVAVHSQMTSTVRSISRQTANNAPRFSKCILEVMKREPELRRYFIPICEWAGFNLNSKQVLKSRNLTAVFREPVEDHVASDEVAIVGTALYAPSPCMDKPILCELVELYAQAIKEPNKSRAAKQLMYEYAQITLSGYLTLMVKYGIGLEGHLQNSIPVFRNGRPVKMLFRDWGGARIYSKRLEKYAIDIHFYPGSLTLTDQEDEMRNKVFYTVYQNHLGELIVQLCQHFAISEQELWRVVFEVTDRVFTQLMTDPDVRLDAIQDQCYFYQEKVAHKALTMMRLTKDGQGYHYVSVPNPLYAYIVEKEM
ncbi:IucA/IucC family protein [Thermoflavimicrobium dichotomicum]|uniref:Siderophore synthetase component n=1 Tax=Thermoflavimicrobium dichotomicum TaxID=46223 RepID=A0A1I3MEW9_9BACL|nr:IucA/IucC family protein [Thermoflavimicrobium dichotomicum]SFI95340.1 Siderophore synthetase component [Thermoflavimicrobium dichotomicum]